MSRRSHVVGPLIACLFIVTAQAQAADLYTHDNWSALASDHTARKVGDLLTVLVYENATASDTADNNASKNFSAQGQVSAGKPTGTGLNEAANLGVNSASDNGATTSRAGSMLAEISVVVDRLQPNGDLHVSGAQVLNINGEKTRIHVEGNVRLADVLSSNVVLSTSLANATIDYDGAGFVSSSAKPGLLSRAINWLGLP